MKTGQQPLLFLNMLLGMMFLGILAEDAFCLLPGRFMLPAAGLLVLAVCVWRKSSKWTGIVFLLLFFVSTFCLIFTKQIAGKNLIGNIA